MVVVFTLTMTPDREEFIKTYLVDRPDNPAIAYLDALLAAERERYAHALRVEAYMYRHGPTDQQFVATILEREAAAIHKGKEGGG